MVIEFKFIMQSNLISITNNSTCMLSNIKIQRAVQLSIDEKEEDGTC